MKFEWATVKDGLMYVGSFGKEYTNNRGEITHTNNLWVIVIDKAGKANHIDWTENYDAVRKELGLEAPGYLIHEAVIWSPENKKWFVLPRRMSKVRGSKERGRGRGKVRGSRERGRGRRVRAFRLGVSQFFSC